jgi:hypothetical protein
MSIKRYNSEKDNTIANALRENLTARSTKANMGASDILELFSIYGQSSSSSVEQTRILLQFPVGTIASDRTSGILPASGSAKFKLKLSNTPHGQTTPENYVVTVHPIVRDWNEGDGLDMESYLDLEASNWVSASSGTPWHTTGSDYLSSSYATVGDVPFQYSQTLSLGTENIEIDITPWTEEWIRSENGNATSATGSVEFLFNPSENDVISFYSHEGKKVTYTFITSSTYSVGNSVYLELSGTAAGTAGALGNRLSSDFGSKITTDLAGAFIALTQSVGGFHGNTIISSSMVSATASIDQFAGGTALPNYGILLKLRDDYENGSKQRSYYTKKFYSRSSHEFFLKPQIEVQWDSAIKDDRNNVIKSSSLAPAADNLNNIYLYNRRRGSLVNIPDTGSALVVQLFTASSGGTAETLPVAGGVSAGSPTFITASLHSTGIYKAQFAYNGSKTSLYDIWSKSDSGTVTTLFTGSGFTVTDEGSDSSDSHYEIPNYKVSITNLKDSYLQSEKTTLRVYTRNKNWQPTIYTVAKNAAPVNTIRDLYYKIVKVSDNYEVISYSTGSTPSYSSVSYDVSGSFFDLDMTLLEENNAYEISFVFKDGSNYIEQQEKFRFRVDP